MNVKRFYNWYWQSGLTFSLVCSPICFEGDNKILTILLTSYTLFVIAGLLVIYRFRRDLFGWFLLKEFVVISIAAFYGYLFCYHLPYCWLIIIVSILLLLPVNSQIEKRLK